MKDIQSIIEKHLSKSTSANEAAELQEWIKDSAENAKYFQQFKALWEASALDPQSFDPNVDQAWQKVHDRTQDKYSAKPKAVATGTTWWRYAAAVVLVAGLGWGILKVIPTTSIASQVTLSTTDARTTTVVLPDGSKVWLNAHSTIRYPEEFSGNRRMVDLEGMAYFDVISDPTKPFQVLTDEVVTTVVGTSFNVRALTDEPEVQITVTSGKVRVNPLSDTTDQVLLDPGYRVVYNKQSNFLEKSTNDDLNFLAWQTGKLTFRDALLPEVVATINSYFQSRVVIENPELNFCKITSTFDNKSLEEILQVLTVIFNGEVKYQQDNILITGTGCQ